MFALGPHFDERARVREYFAGAKGSLDERLLKMPAWSHPNCWLRDETDPWDSLPHDLSAPIDWPDSDPIPPQLQPGYGFQLDVPSYATPEPVVTAILELAELTPSDFLLDLGCGDGRIAITAASRYGVRAEGIDIDPEQVNNATEAAKNAGVADRVSFHRHDLLDADFREATVVTMYLLHDINLRIREKLREQLRPGSRIISRTFDMGDWTPESVIQTALGPIYRWRV
jgi:SAM-dependent methyltransferase